MTPLFPEAHKDSHDIVPAPCFDNTGKFMDRCNPYAKAKKAKEDDLKSAAPKQPPLQIPDDDNDRSIKMS